MDSTLHADIFANSSAYHLTTRVDDLLIVFSTTNSGSAHGERMRITGAGKVGINSEGRLRILPFVE